MKRAAGCLVLLVLMGAALLWCARPRPEDSLVRLDYPEEPSAPSLSEVRVIWGSDKWAIESMEPGERFVGSMSPGDGGGELTVLFRIEGKQHTWDGRVGEFRDGDKTRYGVRITINPLGVVRESHCMHPCEASLLPWWEPWYEQVRCLWRSSTHVPNSASSSSLQRSRSAHGR